MSMLGVICPLKHPYYTNKFVILIRRLTIDLKFDSWELRHVSWSNFRRKIAFIISRKIHAWFLTHLFYEHMAGICSFTCELHSKRGDPFVGRRTWPWNLGVVSRQFANRVAFPSVGGSWLVRRVVWCVVDRAWSSLNLPPIELRSDPLLPSLSFSHSRYILSSSSLRPCRSADLFLPYFPHRSRTLLPVLSTSHPSFALHTAHGGTKLPRDVLLLIDSLRQPRIRRIICMNYFLLPPTIISQDWINA